MPDAVDVNNWEDFGLGLYSGTVTRLGIAVGLATMLVASPGCFRLLNQLSDRDSKPRCGFHDGLPAICSPDSPYSLWKGAFAAFLAHGVTNAAHVVVVSHGCDTGPS